MHTDNTVRIWKSSGQGQAAKVTAAKSAKCDSSAHRLNWQHDCNCSDGKSHFSHSGAPLPGGCWLAAWQATVAAGTEFWQLPSGVHNDLVGWWGGAKSVSVWAYCVRGWPAFDWKAILLKLFSVSHWQCYAPVAAATNKITISQFTVYIRIIIRTMLSWYYGFSAAALTRSSPQAFISWPTVQAHFSCKRRTHSATDYVIFIHAGSRPRD